MKRMALASPTYVEERHLHEVRFERADVNVSI